MNKVFDLTEGSILKKLILVALPILLTTLSQMAYNLTDMFWIGRVDNIGLDESFAVAAVGTASYIPWLAFGVILIGKIGTSVKVSHSVGQKKPHEISVFASNGLLLQLVFGVIFAALILLFKRQFLAIFPIQSNTIVEYALRYISIVGGFIFIQFLVNGFVSINEGLGQTKVNLRILAVGFLVNMVLDPLFILVFRMGLRGAAIATVLSQFITFVLFFVFYKKANPHLKVFHFENFNPEAVKSIIRIGLPIGIQSMIFTVISIYIGRIVYTFGDDVVTAQRIGVQVEQLTWMIASGFQTAITVFVGQNFGAKLYPRIRRGIIYIGSLLVTYSILVSIFIYKNPYFIMNIFLDETPSINYGIDYLKIIYISQTFMMLEGIGSGVFNGIGRTEVPSINSIVGNVIRIPLVLWLSSLWMQDGIWWAMNISSIIKGMAMVIAIIIIFTRLENIKIRTKLKYQRGAITSD